MTKRHFYNATMYGGMIGFGFILLSEWAGFGAAKAGVIVLCVCALGLIGAGLCGAARDVYGIGRKK